MSIRQRAEDFALQHGVRVFPLKDKSNFLMPGSWTEYASRNPKDFGDEVWERANGYGVLLEGLTVVDIDTNDPGRLEIPELPSTLIVKTFDGFHFYYRGELEASHNFEPKLPIQVKSGQGHYVVGPGSTHYPSGAIYRENELSVGVIASAPIAHWVSSVAPEKRPLKRVLEETTRITEGGRNTTLTAFIGAVARYNVAPQVLRSAAFSFNMLHCDPPLEHAEVDACVASAVRTFEASVDVRELQTPESWFLEYQNIEKTVEDLLDLQVPPSIIEGIWPSSAISILVGAPGSYKSFIALDMAYRVATGQNLSDDWVIPEAKKTLYVIGEGVVSYGKRLRAARMKSVGALRFIPRPTDLSNSDQWAGFSEYLRAGEFEAVIFDTFQKNRGAIDENSSDDIRRIFEALDRFSDQTGTNFLFIHHKGKGESSYRGSSALLGDATNVWETLKPKKGPVMSVTFQSMKLRDLEPFKSEVIFGKSFEEDSLYVESYQKPLSERALPI